MDISHIIDLKKRYVQFRLGSWSKTSPFQSKPRTTGIMFLANRNAVQVKILRIMFTYIFNPFRTAKPATNGYHRLKSKPQVKCH